jgi:hypothetical protein
VVKAESDKPTTIETLLKMRVGQEYHKLVGGTPIGPSA